MARTSRWRHKRQVGCNSVGIGMCTFGYDSAGARGLQTWITNKNKHGSLRHLDNWLVRGCFKGAGEISPVQRHVADGHGLVDGRIQLSCLRLDPVCSINVHY